MRSQAKLLSVLHLLVRNLAVLQASRDASNIPFAAFKAWLQSYDLDVSDNRATYVFDRLDADNNSEVSVREYVESQLSSQGDTLCHTAADAATAETAFPGCPCNPVQSAALLACPAGGLQALPCGHACQQSLHCAKRGKLERIDLCSL